MSHGQPPISEDRVPIAQSEQVIAHTPYVPATESRPELTLRGLVLGSVLGIIFAASSVYLAVKVGLTVSASIPVAVLSIAIFRALGRSNILENTIVQTTGSAGESLAFGVAAAHSRAAAAGLRHRSPARLPGGVARRRAGGADDDSAARTDSSSRSTASSPTPRAPPARTC